MWMEETVGKRVNIERIEEMVATEPDVVSTGCPYCMIMLDDGAKDLVQKGKASEDLRILDIAQMLARSVNGRAQTAPAPVEEPASPPATS